MSLVSLILSQLFPLRAQAAVTNRVLELDGKDGYVELPPRMFEGLHEATVEGWVKWRAFGHYFRFLDYGRANDTLVMRKRTPWRFRVMGWFRLCPRPGFGSSTGGHFGH